jgi:hypothetical protein
MINKKLEEFDKKFGWIFKYLEGTGEELEKDIKDFLKQALEEQRQEFIKIVGKEIDKKTTFCKFDDDTTLDWVGIFGYNYKTKEIINKLKI